MRSPNRGPSGRSNRKRGQAMVEFAMVIPIFLLLFAAVADFGFALFSRMTVINAARDGARSAVVLADHSVFTNNYGEEQRPIATEKDGRNADLLVFERGIPTPMVVPLKFVSDDSLPPGSIYRWAVATQFKRDCNWLALTPEWLLLGQNDSPGVWAIPRAELDAAIARERLRFAPSSPTAIAQPPSQP